MPSPDKPCQFCGKLVKSNHLVCHMNRLHSMSSVADSGDVKRRQSCLSNDVVSQRKRSSRNLDAVRSSKAPRCRTPSAS